MPPQPANTPPTGIHPALYLLNRAHPPSIAAEIFTSKVLHKPLALGPTTTSPNSLSARTARRTLRLHKAAQKQRRQKPKPLSAKQKRVLGLYDIPKESQKWEMYLPLRRLWWGYMWEILGLERDALGGAAKKWVDVQSCGGKMASADYHGAEVEVVRSGCVGRVGTRGIVVKDTRFTFVVVTRGNVLRTIPKGGTVFRIEIPLPGTEDWIDRDEAKEGSGVRAEMGMTKPRNLIFELHGSQFEIRATDRATKKFKQRKMDYL